jgi:hypothetical protein
MAKNNRYDVFQTTANDQIWFDPNDARNYQRYQVTIARSGLTDDEKALIPRIFEAGNTYDVLNAAESYLSQYNRQTLRCSYNTKDFLEAVAISCELDMNVTVKNNVWNKR